MLRDGPGPSVTAAPSSPAREGHRDIMVSASTALLGTPPCSPRPPWLSPPIPATPGPPQGSGLGVGCWCPPRTGWGPPGDGAVLAQRALGFAVSAVVPTGRTGAPSDASGVGTGAAGGAEHGAGVSQARRDPRVLLPRSELAEHRAAGRMWGCREGSSHCWELFWRQKRKMKGFQIRKMLRHGVRGCQLPALLPVPLG